MNYENTAVKYTFLFKFKHCEVDYKKFMRTPETVTLLLPASVSQQNPAYERRNFDQTRRPHKPFEWELQLNRVRRILDQTQDPATLNHIGEMLLNQVKHLELFCANCPDDCQRGCALAIIRMVSELSLHTSLDFRHAKKFLTFSNEVIPPETLHWILRNMKLSLQEIPASRIKRGIEKNATALSTQLAPRVISLLFPEGNYSVLFSEITLVEATPKIIEVFTQEAEGILEYLGLGTQDILDPNNQSVLEELAFSILDELNLVDFTQMPYDMRGERKNIPGLPELVVLSREALSFDNPRIPQYRNNEGSLVFNPHIVCDYDRDIYQKYAWMFMPSNIAKLLGITVDELLSNREYDEICKTAASRLPGIINPYNAYLPKFTLPMTSLLNTNRGEGNTAIPTEPNPSAGYGMYGNVILL